MAAGIVYLDVDDEITSAAARIRSSTSTKVALVVPYGSRIATSRMNFRLLSREAVLSNRRLSIVSGDAASRSLAASAGLPVFASVAEYESSLSGGVRSGSSGSGVDDVPDHDPAPGASAAAGAAVSASALAARETVAIPTPDASDLPASGRKSQRPKRPAPPLDAAPATAPVDGIGTPARPLAARHPSRPSDLDDTDADER